MAISIFDLFKIGIGPSSSHTMGPMVAARRFLEYLEEQDLFTSIARVKCNLYGSLGATGEGHGTNTAIILGLIGELPDMVEPRNVQGKLQAIRSDKKLALLGRHVIAFVESSDVIMHKRKSLPVHSNGMQFVAYGADKEIIKEEIYYSIGGGFVVDQNTAMSGLYLEDSTEVPYPFTSAAELLSMCKSQQITIPQLMMENEKAWQTFEKVEAGLDEIWLTMQECVDNGCNAKGLLPGRLGVKRRATELKEKLENTKATNQDPLMALDWVNLYALAVNEENAAGGRVVTAPTNGAAGIVPAVLHYYHHFEPGSNSKGVREFLLTAGAIGLLYKKNASISGAEVGCQGEVGSACSMAAGALCQVLGGTPEQVENAAEIGMEHNLGLTCDPIAGLVQVPCIERNAIASVKAISAARLALQGDGTHFVSLDKVIKTMRATGADMKSKYKETARGGLAVNVIEC